MKVFISWSGSQSKAIAEELRRWLPYFFPTLEVWMSRHNIDKGTRWRTVLAKELESTNYGILCITPDNDKGKAPWILFEAGALSKALGEALVVPFLVGVEHSDLPEPLKEFNPTTANREDTRIFLTSLRNAVVAKEEAAPTEQAIDVLFEKLWPDLEKLIGAATSGPIETTVDAEREAAVLPDGSITQIKEVTADEGPSTKRVDNPYFDMLVAYNERDMAKLDDAYSRLNKLNEDEERPERIPNQCVYLHLRFSLGDAAALEQLHELREAPGAGGAAYYWTGECYRESEQYSKAIQAYDMAAQRAVYPSTRANSQVSQAKCMYKIGHKEEAIEFLIDAVSKEENLGAVSALYEGIADLYKANGEYRLRAVCLEKALEGRPNDVGIHFEVAYAYSYEEKEFSPLALLHYKTLLQFNPAHRSGWNNLGVQHDRSNSNGLAVQAFKKAMELNNTLASSNLALKYISGGCYDEAINTLKEAQRQDDVDKSVGTTFAHIIELQEEEAQKTEQAQIGAREQQNYILSFADAFFADDVICPAFGGTWASEDVTALTIIQTGSEVSGEWTKGYSDYRLTGRLRKRGAQFNVLRKSYSSYDRIGYGYMYLSNDGQHLVMMVIEKSQHQLWRLKWILPPEPEEP